MFYNIALVFVSFLAVTQAAVSVGFTSDTVNVIEGVTSQMTLNCSVPSMPQGKSLINIAIKFKYNSTSADTPLVNINSASPNSPHILKNFGGQATGAFAKTGLSYLALRWSYPLHDNTGVYVCIASVLDLSIGSIQTFEGNLTVNPSESDVKTIIGILQKCNSDLTNAKDNLNSNVSSRHQTEKDLQELKQKYNGLQQTMNTTKNNLSATKQKLTDQLHRIQVLESFLKNSMSSYQGHFYNVIRQTGDNFTVAQDKCVSGGGYLAEITSNGEWTFIQKFLGDVYGPWIYFGLVKDTSNNWVNALHKTSNPVLDWGTGDPQAQYKCGNLRQTNNQWKMFSGLCDGDTQMTFLCEYEY